MMMTDLKMPTNSLTFYLAGGCESIYLPLNLSGLVTPSTTGVWQKEHCVTSKAGPLKKAMKYPFWPLRHSLLEPLRHKVRRLITWKLHGEATCRCSRESPSRAQSPRHPSPGDIYVWRHAQMTPVPNSRGNFAIQGFPHEAPDTGEQRQVPAMPCLNL